MDGSVGPMVAGRLNKSGAACTIQRRIDLARTIFYGLKLHGWLSDISQAEYILHAVKFSVFLK